jgi:hypothetical protein
MTTSAPGTFPLNEFEIVQNPALGAYAIWRFGLGFQSEEGRPAALPLAFLILPLVLHRPTLEMINSTRKALCSPPSWARSARTFLPSMSAPSCFRD